MLTLLVYIGTHWYMQEYIHVQYTSNVKAASHLYLPCTHEPIASALCDMRCNLPPPTAGQSSVVYIVVCKVIELEMVDGYLHCRWLPEVQNIFFQGNRRKQIPLEHLDSFFDGVAVMMTNQLREMALDSIADYLHIFCPVKVK